jgi:undecaprenyl diphosphate synthase
MRPAVTSADTERRTAPRHVAIIPDGNRRWAWSRGLTVHEGHAAGIDAFWRVLPTLLRAQTRFVTIYLFSTENWTRTAAEVGSLMRLLTSFFEDCADRSRRMGFRPVAIGDLDDDRVPEQLRLAAKHATNAPVTDDGPVVTFAVNYGSIQDLAQSIARNTWVATEASAALSTTGLPSVDLLVRTGGQRRLSNFLLLESAYAELSFPDVLWPDIQPADIIHELRVFGRSERRFGGDGPANT